METDIFRKISNRVLFPCVTVSFIINTRNVSLKKDFPDVNLKQHGSVGVDRVAYSS